MWEIFSHRATRFSFEEDEQPPELPSEGVDRQATTGKLRLPQPREEFVGTVLTGPPGCGKSSILLLVLAYLAQNKCTLVYR